MAPSNDVTGAQLRSHLLNYAVLAATLLVLLLAIELAFRLLGMADPVLYRSDPIFGYEPQPNQSAVRLGVPIYINDVGLRDDEGYSRLMRGSPRILVIGNSVTYGGSRIRQQDLFTEILERELRSTAPYVKVLNAGVNGYSVTQMMKRAPRLLRAMRPDFLILYVIRGDFDRPPIQLLADGNFVYPTSRPRSALADFLLLAINHLNARHHIVPRRIANLWAPPPNFVPAYDGTRIIDLHFASVEEFMMNEWETSGRGLDRIVVFVSPAKSEVLGEVIAPSSDLVRRFAKINIKAHDLRMDFYDQVVAKGYDLDDYFWDEGHYTEKGHALAARIIQSYLRKEQLAHQ